MKYANFITSFKLSAMIRYSIHRWSSTAIQNRNQVFWEMLDLKNKGRTVTEIVEPLIRHKKRTTQAPPAPVYRLLFDLSENSQDRDSVIRDFARYYDYHVFIADSFQLCLDKFLLLLESLQRVNNYTSLSDVLKLLFTSSHHNLIDSFISYGEGSIPSSEVLSLLSSIETNISSLHTFSSILKCAKFDTIGQINTKLIQDNKLLKYTTQMPTSLILRLFFLQIYANAYKSKNDPQQISSKIESILTSFEHQLKNFDWKQTKISNSVNFFTRSGALSDLIEGCVKHRDIKLGILVHHIFHTPSCLMLQWNKSRYLANMIHLQCIARLLNPDFNTLHSIPDMTKFIEYDFLSDVKQYCLSPDVHTYFAYLHLASLDITQTKYTYRYLSFLDQTKQLAKLAPLMTKWTRYFPNPRDLHINVYCSVLQLTTRHSYKANIILTYENVRDLLVNLSPRLESTQDIKQLNKFLNFFNSEFCIQFEKSETEMPLEYHNLILQAFSKTQIFEAVQNKFNHMASQQAKINSTTINILLDAAMGKSYKEHLEYIITDVWSYLLNNAHSCSKDTKLLRKFLMCSIRGKNVDKIMLFLDHVLKNGVPISELHAEIVKVHKICKRQEVLVSMESFRDILSEHGGNNYEDILMDINKSISEFQPTPPITSPPPPPPPPLPLPPPPPPPTTTTTTNNNNTTTDNTNANTTTNNTTTDNTNTTSEN